MAKSRKKGRERAAAQQRAADAVDAVDAAAQVGHEERGHAPLPPSASSRWLACAPSQGYIKRLVEAKTIKKRESGPAAQRGTRIHEHGEQFVRWLLAGKKIDSFKAGDPEEIAEAKDYARYVMRKRDELEQLYGPVSMGVEDRAVMVDGVCWGSRDVWLLAGRHLCIVDLKTGREPVCAQGNTQEIIYAFDLVEKHDPKTIELCVWQPNASDGLEPERSYVYRRAAYGREAQKIVQGVREAAKWLDRSRGHEKHLSAGDHCGWCDALGVCPAARERNLAISSEKFAPVPIDRTSLPDTAVLEADQVAEILRRAPMFQAWLDAVQTRALELSSKGKKVPGFKVVQKVTRRAWDSRRTDAQIARTLGLRIEQVTKTVRLSPAEVEKQLDKRGKEKLSALVFRPEGLPTIVPESDRRAPMLATKINFHPVSREEEID